MMPACPWCSDSLLHHIRNNRTYWFCLNCRQEMPVWGSPQLCRPKEHQK